ncbi:MAG TPA: hypothetical protein VGJ46_00915 [Candidatus Limnocylindrales bacterium]|jgi:hypothetical protein|nr:MAG: hypothetical protein E6I45_10530 [Chloroflexota bacterium]
MDIRSEARRLTNLATVLVWIGWIGVAYALISGIFWWIDLANSRAFNLVQALGLSLSAIGGPIFLALIVAAVGHFMRLFAMYAGSHATT